MGAITRQLLTEIALNEEHRDEALVDVVNLWDPAAEEPFIEDEFCEPTESEIETYTNSITNILKRFNISTFEDCEMVRCALQNVLIPNCEYLLSFATNKISQEHQAIFSDVTERLNYPQNYVVHPDHTEIYSEIVHETIRHKLSELSIFSSNLAEKMRKKQQRQEELKIAQFNQVLEDASKLSSAQLSVTLFLVTVELINRDRPLPLSISDTLTPALKKIKEEHISTQQITDLSRAECNRLVFDGASSEALDILEKLVTERNMMQRPSAL